MPSPYAYDLFTAAGAYEKSGNAAMALQTLRQGLSFPYANPPIRSFATPFANFAADRALARLLAQQVQVQEAKGDWNGAINSTGDDVAGINSL